MTQLVRSAHGSPVTLFQSNGVGGTYGSHYMPWNPIMLPDGTELVAARKSSGHAGSIFDGNIVAKTRPPGGSWSAEATILDTAYNEGDGFLGLLADGTICMTWNRVEINGTYPDGDDDYFYAPFSKCPPGEDPLDPGSWTTPVHITGAGLANNWRAGMSILELTPGGRIVVGLYGTPTFPPWVEDQCWIAYSDDGGATWGMLSQLDNGNAHALSSSAEPQLVLCTDGSVLAVYRTLAAPWEAWARRSTDGCATWSAEWKIADNAVNKVGALMTPDGDVVIAYNAGASTVTFKQSWDDGDTFGSAQSLGLSGNLFALPYVIGEAGVTPNVAIVYGYEQSGQLEGNVYYQQLTRGTDTPAPAITASDVAGITDTAATITGNVNPNGAATTYHVEYGLTTGYGSQTSPVSAGSGSSPVAVEVDLTGLDADTGYHARLVAVSANGTTNGPDVPFATDPAPPPAVGLTLDESSIFTQLGTAITARALTGRRSSVGATAYSLNGGAIWVTGDDTAAFDIDGDPVDGQTAIVLTAGVPRDLELGVTPVEDGPLSIQIGVPE